MAIFVLTCTADVGALMLIIENAHRCFNSLPKDDHGGLDVPLFSTERMDNLPEAIAPAKPILSP